MILLELSNKHFKTLQAIFKDPVQSNIEWNDIEALFKALGGQISEGRGSCVRVKLNDSKAVFHRPHPEKETDKGAVKSVRMFLREAGFAP
ncbi:type II toxin-antitoxin system HicA family toxin [Saccharibacillus sacchari]|uniref:Type II toxin-antitoxin system HicA family toxin n=1 Tax=Saccharibacillus sacchari TaxID=456493 RepID=A0ACC6PH94_9BACL